MLELQLLIDKCYRNAGYDDLDYRQPLEPPLTEAAAEWMENSCALRQSGEEVNT